MNVTVLGAGAWGTAIATALSARQPVVLYARSASHCAMLERERTNARYLASVTLPDEIELTSDLTTALAHGAQGLMLIATPTDALCETLRTWRAMAPLTPFVWLCKGFEQVSGRLPHQIVRDVCGGFDDAGPLSGPSFAIEVAHGLPTALTVAGPSQLCDRATTALHGGAIRI